jgi:hypothetical protein
LRQAGAVVLGKANLSEWANFCGGREDGIFINGWSARGGFTRNPYGLDFDPCGSSSGSAVASAANLCAAAVGTETDGSIVCPAGNNLVVGLKPTVGLISQQGIIPIAHSQDTAGPIARTVTDAAILRRGRIWNSSSGRLPIGVDRGEPGLRIRDVSQNLKPNTLCLESPGNRQLAWAGRMYRPEA